MNIRDLASAVSNVNMVTTPHVQQSVTPVSFASTTQVWMDIPVPPTVNTIIPPVSTTRVPLSQIPSVASTTNTLPSSQPQEQNVDPCRKCGKKTQSTNRCRKRVICKNCKGKDHGTRFCTIAPAPDYKCTFCRKENTLQRTAEQGRKLRRKLGQENYQSPQITHSSTSPSDFRVTSGMSSFSTQFRNATDTDRFT